MAEKITMSSQATIDANGESKLVYYRDDDAIHSGQDAGSTIINFTNADVDSGITDFTSFLTKIISGISIKKFVADFKEGCNYILNAGNVVDNLTSNSSTDVLSARQGKLINDCLTLYSSTSGSTTAETTFASALSAAFTGKSLDNNRSYPVMLYISGSNFSGNYTGVLNKTSTADTFLISNGTLTYSGIYNRSNNTVTNLSRIANQSDIDTINSRLNFSLIISVPSTGWAADTSGVGGYSQTLSATGVTTSTSLLIDVYHDSSVSASNFATQCEAFFEWASSGWAVAGTNSITLRCNEAPSGNFTIIVTGK